MICYKKKFVAIICMLVTTVSISIFIIHRIKLDHVQGATCESLSTTVKPNSHTKSNEEDILNMLVPNLLELSKVINKAKQHVRGSKTNEALMRAKSILNKTLNILNFDWNNVTQRTIHPSVNICPENFVNSLQGHPYCDTAHEQTQCHIIAELKDLISILVVFYGANEDALSNLITSIRSYDKDVSILISAQSIDPGVTKKDYNSSGNVMMFNYQMGYTVGKQFNDLLHKADTRYVLIARDITWFSSDARLQRLIGQIERLNASTAGGSIRDEKGHWSNACQQRAFRNYTLVYEAGYDESMHECLFCDHLDGPFVIETEVARHISFQNKIKGEGLFEDFFLRLDKREHIVCPDAMFYVNKTEKDLEFKNWKSFIRIRGIQRMKFSSQEMHIPCPKSYECKFIGGALSPCCHKENVNLVNTAMDLCEQLGAVCELDSGTLLGAVKLHTILPWEVDADTFFLSSYYSVLNQSKEIFTKAGYDLTADDPSRELKCCYEDTNLTYSGYFALRSNNWRLEYNGMPYLTSEDHLIRNKSFTKILLNGNWVRVPTNPGLDSRNCYGYEIYQHSLHGSESKTPGYPKFFVPCERPGHHSCLSNYNVDGNLQFKDPIP